MKAACLRSGQNQMKGMGRLPFARIVCDYHLFKKPVNRSIHGPFRKWILQLASEVNPLKDAAD